MQEETTTPLLEVEHLTVSFSRYAKGFRRITLPGVRYLSFTLNKGELLAVVGASGSGKSLLAHRLLGILPNNANAGGRVLYKGQPLTNALAEKLRGSQIMLVPQNVSSLDPLMQVERQVKGEAKGKKADTRARKALRRYGLGEPVEKMYPFQLSGGMARRVLIACAVQTQPELVVADEPTPGLHPEAVSRVLQHFKEIAQDGAGVLLITHDLEAALEVADRVIVLYAGAAVEEAPADCFAQEQLLQHPYTKALWRASPNHGFEPLAGTQPVGQIKTHSCLFYSRCPQAVPECERTDIPYQKTERGYVRCILAGGMNK